MSNLHGDNPVCPCCGRHKHPEQGLSEEERWDELVLQLALMHQLAREERAMIRSRSIPTDKEKLSTAMDIALALKRMLRSI